MDPLELEVDDLSKVDEKYHDLYEQDVVSNKYRLTNINGGSWGDRDRMTRALANEREKTKQVSAKSGEYKAALDEYKKLGSVEDLQTFMNDSEKDEKSKPDPKLSLAEKNRQRELDQEREELVTLRQRNAELEANLKTSEISGRWQNLLQGSKIDAKHHDFMNMLSPNFDLVDGKMLLKTEVMGVAEGSTAEDLIANLVKTKPHLLGETTATSSGKGATGAKKVNPFIDGTLAEQQEYEAEHGHEKALEMYEQAKIERAKTKSGK